MADETFAFSWVPNTYGAMLQRQAVLYPLMGRAKSAEDITAKTRRLVGMWRARLHALKQEGWSPGTKYKDTQYVRNCPPTFVYTTPHTRQCKIRYLCPFCYARWVLAVWQRLDETFPNPRDESEVVKLAPTDDAELAERIREMTFFSDDAHDGRQLRSIDLGGARSSNEAVRAFPYHLLTREVEKPHPFKRDRDGETYASYAAHLLSQLATARSHTITKMHTLGSFAFTTLVPTDDKWKILHKELHIVPADYEVPGVRGTIRRIERPSRRRLFRTTARVCAYPRELMYGDAAMTKAALEARRGMRLSASYGVCRQAHRRI